MNNSNIQDEVKVITREDISTMTNIKELDPEFDPEFDVANFEWSKWDDEEVATIVDIETNTFLVITRCGSIQMSGPVPTRQEKRKVWWGGTKERIRVEYIPLVKEKLHLTWAYINYYVDLIAELIF